MNEVLLNTPEAPNDLKSLSFFFEEMYAGYKIERKDRISTAA